MNEEQFKNAKDQANSRAAAFAASSPSASPPSVAAAVYNGNNFQGLSSNGVTSPSDSTGDASATQQVEMVNSAVTVFPSSCSGPCGQPSAPLYNLVGASPGDCVFDPQIAWDQQWGRWIFVMTMQRPSVANNCSGSATITDDRLVVGWTYTADANDFLKANVCWIQIDHGSNLDDFPKLGHDDNSLVVGANVFSNYGRGPFLNSAAWVVSKPSSVSATNGCGIGGASIKQSSLGATVFSPVPADMTDSSSVDYVVASQQPRGGTANQLFVWQSSVTSGLTFMGYFGVASYQLPPDVPQPATGTGSCATSGNCLDASDARLTQVIGHYDPDVGGEALWTSHTIGDPRLPARSVLRWYEVLPAAGLVRQSGNLADSSLYLFNGTVSPTSAGNEAVIIYNAGSAATNGFASFRAQSRNPLTPLGTMSNENVLASSSVNDTDFTCGASQSPPQTFPCRWGDYSAARPDPANANAVWGFEMLTGGGGTTTSAGWSTQVAEMTPGCSTVQLAAAAAGNGVAQLTASGATGCSNPQYQFYLQAPGGAWTVVQTWSTNNVWTWNTSGYRPGTYNIDVWANQFGDSTLSAESFAVTQWTIPFCTSAGVSANFISPQPSGTKVTLTASSTCPNPSPQYQFWLLPPGGSWTVVQPYSANSIFNWDTTSQAPGTYHLSVWVRDASSSGAFGTPPNTYDAYAPLDFVLQPAPCTGMTASASPASTATVGTAVSVKGTATGCPNPRYEFWLLPPGGSWSLVQAYSANATYGWNTSGLPAGAYRFSVWARDASSTASYDAYDSSLNYTLNLATCSAVSVSYVPASPASAGTKVTVTGAATGCPNPRYEFWFLPAGGSWSLVQAYSSFATFSWNSGGWGPGTYLFSVWARDAASSAGYDAFNSSQSYTLTLTTCTAVAVSYSPASPSSAGTTITVTGAASGCPNPRYQFWFLPPGGSWRLVQGYSASATFTWNSGGWGPGIYLFSVWARDASSSAGYDAYNSSQSYTLQ
jgi:hypothetical protein